MADTPVLVPIELTVKDINVEDVNLSDVKKSINEKLIGTTKAINQVFSKIDLSRVSGSVRNAMSQVSKSTAAAYKAQQQFQKAVIEAAESSKYYKQSLEALSKAQETLKNSKIRRVMQSFEDERGNLRKDLTPDMRARYASLKAQYDDMVRLVQELEQEVRPENFAMSGSEEKVAKLVGAYQQLIETITRADSAQHQFNEAARKDIYTADYQRKLKELEDLSKKVDAISEKSARMQELGATDRAWERLNYDADILKQKIEDVVEELKVMVNEGQAFTFGGNAAAEIDRVVNSADNLTESLDNAKYEARSSGVDITSVFRSLNSACDRVVHGIGRVIKQLGRLRKSGKSTSFDLNKSVRKLWKNFLMFGLGFRSMYFFIKKIRTTFINSIKQMAEVIPEVNVQVSSLMTSINQLKGSIGTAFQPIMDIVVPALNELIAALVRACNAVGRFLAVLTGQGYIYEYTAAEVDYAKSLEGTADAADEAKRSLMGFDQLNRLNGEDEDKGGGGAGKDKEGTWNLATIEDAYSRLAELMKIGWEIVDFTDVGAYLAEQLKNALAKAQELLEGPIKEFGNKIATLLATALNGFTADLDLATQIGSTVASALNTLFENIDTFFRETDWASIGAFIATSLFTAIDETDFKLIGQTIGDYILAGITLWWSTVTNFEALGGFERLGEQIGNAINGFFERLGEVDPKSGLTGWQKLGQALSKSIRGIITTITTALDTVNWDEVGQAIGEFISSIEWKDIVLDLWNLAKKIVKSLGEVFRSWEETDPLSAGITELLVAAFIGIKVVNLVTPFITKLTKLFTTLSTDVGLASAGSVLGAAIAGAIIGGLIGELLDRKVLAPLVEKFTGDEGLAGAFRDFHWGGEGGAFQIIGEAFSEYFADYDFGDLTRDWIHILGLDTFFDKDVPAKFEVFRMNWTTGWENIKTKTSIVAENIKTKVTTSIDQMKQRILTRIGEIKQNWIDRWETIKNETVTKWTTIKQKVTGNINNIKEKLETRVLEIKNTWETNWGNIKQTVIDVWNEIAEKIKTPINTILGFINKLMSGVVDGMNAVVDSINAISLKVPDWIPELGGKSIGFNLRRISAPQIPLLAQGAVIPPNKEFLAMLGDQKHGTNIEAPLETIVSAFKEAVSEMGNFGGTIILPVYLDSEKIAEKTIHNINNYARASGKRSFV